MNQQEKKYAYQSSWTGIILGLLLFGATAILFLTKAVYNKKGVVINRVIELSEMGATIFYWILFTASLLFVIASIIGIYFKLHQTEFLVLNEESILIPPVGLKRQKTNIKYGDIISLNETKVSNNIILTIKYNGGKRAILSNLLESKSEYQNIKSYIIHKTGSPAIS
ncbi:hypothetical protein GCM10022393_42340 [Aquimarina addita]|uniref:Uncharacterized protein n=1 Tax=Aquimarina addita TaxID=870485 RepID=A0ABP6UXY9_9FLAO